MKIVAIIQARMGSQRFPRKVLHTVLGKPILQYLLERVHQCGHLDATIVATSTEPDDNLISDFCHTHNVACYRGPLNNVAGRFRHLLDLYQFEGVVRLCADSPLLDQSLIDQAVEIFLKGNFDIVTNVFPRSYPRGQSVEVLRTKTFCQTYQRMQDAFDLEHVTNFFYRNRHEFKIFNFSSATDYSNIRLCIDTRQDMNSIKAIASKMDKPHWLYGYQEIIRLYKEINP